MKKDNEQLILEIARKHFITKGFQSTRMQEIADEAKINKAMLHYYFRSKEKLYQHILEDILKTIVPMIGKAMNNQGTFWERVEALVSTYIDTLCKHPEIPIFIMTELSQKRENFINTLKLRTAVIPSIQSFVMVMSEDMQAGKLRKANPAHIILNILAMSVFPFMAKPVFNTIFDFNEKQFLELMKERKEVILNFLKHALIP